MSHNHYTEINLHIVWHTKLSGPLLSAEIEAPAHGSVQARITATEPKEE